MSRYPRVARFLLIGSSKSTSSTTSNPLSDSKDSEICFNNMGVGRLVSCLFALFRRCCREEGGGYGGGEEGGTIGKGGALGG
jgi:hypothetical protein